MTKNAVRSKKVVTTSSANPNVNPRAKKFREDTKLGYLDHVKTDQNLTDAIDLLKNVIFPSKIILTFFRVAKTSKAYIKKNWGINPAL
jgi:hypothetical protein